MIKMLQVANLIGLLFVLTMNGLANALPIAGKTTGELSDLYPNLFVPAGITFSIWGVIYLLLIGFIIIQSRGLFQKDEEGPAFVGRIGWWFVANCLLNGVWILVWHNQYILLSLLIMLGILGTLVVIYRKIVLNYQSESSGERLLAQLPFRIYLGWICIATIANTTAFLVDQGWTGGSLGESTWAIIAIVLGFLVNLYFVLKLRDAWLPLVGVWAFAGIIIKRIQVEPQMNAIIITAAITGLTLLVFSIVRLARPS